MADDGGGHGGGAGGGGGGHGGGGGAHAGGTHVNGQDDRRPKAANQGGDDVSSPMSPALATPNPFSRRATSMDLDDYFTGPRDMSKHSKWPIFLQMHGSILPKIILPLVFMGAWASVITYVHMKHKELSVNPVLLTILGFVVGLGLSFRSSTAYERYAEGRRYWATLITASHTLGRVFWVHAVERPETREKDILAKLTAMNLVTSFAIALKHKLRFEPYTGYDDLQHMVGHIDTLALRATQADPEKIHRKKPNMFKAVGEYLGVSFAESNPRKALKKAAMPLGNLPLEIISYLASFTDQLVANQQLPVPMQQTLAYNNIALLNDILTGTERVLTTPLPIAYGIAIAQITWVYVILLPFQLTKLLEWLTIPATVAASYIILGLLFIGREIENPFGQDVNDLPLEAYCAQIAAEIDVIASRPKPRNEDWIETMDNKVLFPLSTSGWQVWMHRGESKLREALRQKTELGFEARKELMGHDGGEDESPLAKYRSRKSAEKANKADQV